MSYVLVNGVPAYTADISLPRAGVWRAELSCGLSKMLPPGTRVLISADNGRMQWVGTVKRAGVQDSRQLLTVLGGAGGMGTVAPARAYQSCALRTPLVDLLTFAGEVLSTKSSPSITGKSLLKWARDERAVGESLTSLAETAGPDVVWRVLPDGSTWIGEESWQENRERVEVLAEDPILNRFRIGGGKVVDVRPGQTLDGRRVSYVEHSFSAARLRTRVWAE